ncbi:hypothetical protein PTTG_30175, partial [Puccinia triticina 1-1 BBBD Race 1]
LPFSLIMPCKTDRQHLHEEVEFTLVTSLWKMQMADCLSIEPFRSNPLNELLFSFTKLAILQKMKFPDNVIRQHVYLMLANFQYCQSSLAFEWNWARYNDLLCNNRLLMLLSFLDDLSRTQYLVSRVPRPRIASLPRTFDVLTATGGTMFMKWAQMSLESFLSLVSAIENHHVFYNNSNHAQAPVEWQLLV